jgi:hypothetical protein
MQFALVLELFVSLSVFGQVEAKVERGISMLTVMPLVVITLFIGWKMWIIDPGYWDSPNSPIRNVDTPTNERRFTGLYDHKGSAIYREPNEIGFGRKQNVYSKD